MAVKLAAAHIDERDKATGDKAGDQTGKEVCTRAYYVHSKSWRVFRPIVITNGSKASAVPVAVPTKLGDRLLINSMSGPDVKELQTDLIKLGYSCGAWGAERSIRRR